MKKNKKRLLILVLLLLFVPLIIRADSGWDTGYDGGGSSESSYDSGSGSDQSTVCIVFLFALVIASICEDIYKKNKLKNYSVEEMKIIENKINSIDPSLNNEEIKKIAFDIYEKVQIAWMNFDYKTLEQYCSDELYNTYKMQLEALNAKGQKNIMENINCINCIPTDISLEDNKETINVRLTIRMKDYVVNSNGKVMRGNSSTTYEITYEMTIIRNIGNNLGYCPNCNSKLNAGNHQKCDYCGSIIVSPSSKFVMSKKKNINQKIY